MKTKLIILLLITFGFIHRTNGQDTTLLDENYMQVVHLEHAKFFRVNIPNKSPLHKTVKLYDLNNYLVSLNDTTYAKDSSYSYSSKEWYDSSTNLYEVRSGTFKDTTINTSVIRYFKNGKVQFQYQTINELLNGKVLSYWPNGKLKRKEVYKKDVLVNGNVWNQKGKKIKYYPFKTPPDFKMDLHQYFARNIRYTKDAQREDISGKIIVRFAIDTNGNVTNIKILKPLYPSLDKEVVRVLKTLSNITPGTLDGEKINSFYRIPITFQLSN